MNYAVSKNGKQIAFAKKDEIGISHLWLAAPDHRSSPRQIPSTVNEDSPDPIFDFFATSPDGRWAAVQTKGPDDEHPYTVVAYPVEGGRSVRLCNSLCWGSLCPHSFEQSILK